MILVIMGFILLVLLVSMGDTLKWILEFFAYLAAPAVIFVVNALADVTCEKKMNKQQRIRKDVIAMIISGCVALLYILYMGYKKDLWVSLRSYRTVAESMFGLRSLMIAASLVGLFLRNLINFKCERNPDLHPEYKPWSAVGITYGLFLFLTGYMTAIGFFGILGAALIVFGILGLMTALRPIRGTTEEEKAKTKKLDSRRNKIVGIPLALLLAVVVFTQMSFDLGSTSTSSSRKGRGGYNMPSGNQTLTEYIQQEDPDLWNSMQDRWNSLGN